MNNIRLNFLRNFKILFIVPTLNSYHLLPKLVNSIQNQSFKNWEIIFIDGDSNLPTQEMVRKFL